MSNVDSALYTPYGAYELKSTYQRNLMLGTVITLTIVVAVVGASLLVDALQSGPEAINSGPTIIRTIAELGPPPTIARKPPQVNVSQPNLAAPRVGIPRPVADEEVLDDNVVLATRAELAEIVPNPRTIIDGRDNLVVDIDETVYLPEATEFVPVEIYPEMIYEEPPVYPRLAQQAGLEGIVWIQALVDKEGTVRKAQVARSSGSTALDEAAVEAAYKNKFKPGIQNGRPVAVWVTYRVGFQLSAP